MTMLKFLSSLLHFSCVFSLLALSLPPSLSLSLCIVLQVWLTPLHLWLCTELPTDLLTLSFQPSEHLLTCRDDAFICSSLFLFISPFNRFFPVWAVFAGVFGSGFS